MSTTAQTRVVLLAGGKGERFWPRSTPDTPKQFLRLSGDKSLLRATFERILPLFPVNSVYVVTGDRYADVTRWELPELPQENLILEPEGRDTAASLGLAALWLEQIDPDCVMVALAADHHIVGEGRFRSTIQAAVEGAQCGGLITLGVRPTRAETGYGYIQVGDVVDERGGLPIHRVLGFKEKPDIQTAEKYISSGDFLWNSGIFVWKVSSLRNEIAYYLPEFHAILQELAGAGGLDGIRNALPHLFPLIKKISIDYGVLEKSQAVRVIPAYFGWDDIGTWSGVGRLRELDDHGNSLVGEVIAYDCRNAIVEGDRRLVALVGVSDVIVVDSENALLVCAKSRAEDVKKVAGLVAPFRQVRNQPGEPASPAGRVVERSWGREIWWAETMAYASKLVVVNAGCRVEWNCPRGDQESLYFQAGEGQLYLDGSHETACPGHVVSLESGVNCQLETENGVVFLSVCGRS